MNSNANNAVGTYKRNCEREIENSTIDHQTRELLRKIVNLTAKLADDISEEA